MSALREIIRGAVEHGIKHGPLAVELAVEIALARIAESEPGEGAETMTGYVLRPVIDDGSWIFDEELPEHPASKNMAPATLTIDLPKRRRDDAQPPPNPAELRKQLDTRLKPVLRQRDYDEFNLVRAIETVTMMARAVSD